MMRKCMVALVAIPTLLVSACSAGGGNSTDSSTIHVGVPLSLTGGAAFGGVPAQNALKVAAKIINKAPKHYLGSADRQITFSYQDAGADISKATTIFRGFAKDQSVTSVIGPTTSTQAMAVGPFAQKLGLPVIVPSATSSEVTKPGDYVFQVALVGDKQVAPLVDYTMKTFSPNRVCVVYTSDNQGNADLGEGAIRLFRKAGAEVTKATVLYNDTDFASTVTKFKNADCNAVYLVLPSPADAAFMVQARRVGYKPQFLGSSTLGAAVPNARNTATGSVYTSDYNVDLDTPLNQRFVSMYQAATNSRPDVYAAQAFSSAMIVANAVSHIKGDVTRKNLDKALANVDRAKVVVGTGIFSFDANRQADFDVPRLKVQRDGTSKKAE